MEFVLLSIKKKKKDSLSVFAYFSFNYISIRVIPACSIMFKTYFSRISQDGEYVKPDTRGCNLSVQIWSIIRFIRKNVKQT